MNFMIYLLFFFASNTQHSLRCVYFATGMASQNGWCVFGRSLFSSCALLSGINSYMHSHAHIRIRIQQRHQADGDVSPPVCSSFTCQIVVRCISYNFFKHTNWNWLFHIQNIVFLLSNQCEQQIQLAKSIRIILSWLRSFMVFLLHFQLDFSLFFFCSE